MSKAPAPNLAHDASPDAYGAAMVLCQGYAPACSDAGECNHGGLCFGSSHKGYRLAHAALKKLRNETTDPHAAAWLSLALSGIEAQYRREVELAGARS